MEIKDNGAYLLYGLRTAIGKNGGSLKGVKPHHAASTVMRHVIRRTGINPAAIDQVIVGQAYQDETIAPNIARVAAQLAGIPDSVYAWTLHNQCGSGLMVIAEAAEKIWLDRGDLFLVGGVEIMSAIRFTVEGKYRWSGGLARFNPKSAKFFPLPTALLGPLSLAENGLAPRKLIKDMRTLNMAGTAAEISSRLGISIDEIDRFAVLSQERAQAAIQSGRIAREIVPINTGKLIFDRDENPRADTSLIGIKELRQRSNSQTKAVIAPTASPIADGAAFVLIGSGRMARQLGLTPLVEIVDFELASVPHETMGLGPVYAVSKILERNNLTIDDVNGELNEAFSAQFLGCKKMLGFDIDRWNIRGGALSFGHPIAMSGARIANSLALDMNEFDLEWGIATACVAAGMSPALLLRNFK